MRARALLLALAAASLLGTAGSAAAQDKPAAPPPPPPKPWTGSLGAGLAITSGNSSSTNFNLSFEVKYDPKTRNVFKATGLYLRTDSDVKVTNPDGSYYTESRTTADKAALLARDEYSITDRFFVFGEVGYTRDKIALVDYLISPTVGAGYKVVKTDAITLDFSGGVGGAFEKDSGRDATSSGAFKASEAFAWQISKGSKLTQNLTGLWKTDDTSDANYHFDVALATSVSKLLELKVAWLLDYKNRPVDPTLKKSDSAFLVALVAKF